MRQTWQLIFFTCENKNQKTYENYVLMNVIEQIIIFDKLNRFISFLDLQYDY